MDFLVLHPCRVPSPPQILPFPGPPQIFRSFLAWSWQPRHSLAGFCGAILWAVLTHIGPGQTATKRTTPSTAGQRTLQEGVLGDTNTLPPQHSKAVMGNHFIGGSGQVLLIPATKGPEQENTTASRGKSTPKGVAFSSGHSCLWCCSMVASGCQPNVPVWMDVSSLRLPRASL